MDAGDTRSRLSRYFTNSNTRRCSSSSVRISLGSSRIRPYLLPVLDHLDRFHAATASVTRSVSSRNACSRSGFSKD